VNSPNGDKLAMRSRLKPLGRFFLAIEIVFSKGLILAEAKGLHIHVIDGDRFCSAAAIFGR